MANDIFTEYGFSKPEKAAPADDIFAEYGFSKASVPAPTTEHRPGSILGTLGEGLRSTGRAVGAAVDTYVNDQGGVTAAAREQQAAPKHEKLDAFYQDIARRSQAAESRRQPLPEGASTWDTVKAKGGELLDSIKDVGSAVVANPAGAGHALVEQLPNSGLSLAGGWAGMKAGALAGGALGSVVPGLGTVTGGTAGSIIGGLAGMFGANTLLETGNKAMETGRDGAFTEAERTQAMQEGAVKGGVITGVDALTLGASKWITGATTRAMSSAAEVATRRALTDAGIDIADEAAVLAARSNPAIQATVQQAQAEAIEAARLATDTFGKNALRLGAAGALETVGEGLGEYLGELAATGNASMMDAVLESVLSLGQSGAEVAWGALRNKSEAPQADTSGQTLDALGQEMDQTSAEMAGAMDNFTGMAPPNAGLLPAPERPEIITVPNAAGGETTIDRKAGPLSAAVVDTGIAQDMLRSQTLLRSFPNQAAAQAELEARPDADRYTIARHPRAKDRFAVVPKDRQTLAALDEAKARQQQLLDEEGEKGALQNGRANQESGESQGAVGARSGGFVAGMPGILRAEGGAAGTSAAADVEGVSVGAAGVSDQALTGDAAQTELAPAPAQPVAELPGPAAQRAQRLTQARAEAEARGATLVDEEASMASPAPSPAQIAAGNYKKGHVKVGPLSIAVENPIGSTRRGKEKGKPWETQMQAHYGYVKRTTGADGDQVDVFLKEGTANDFTGTVYVIDQFNPATGRFDEHKAMIGYRSQAEAAVAYDAHFADGSGPKRRRAVVAMPMESFARWAREGNTSQAVSQAGQQADAAQAEIEQSTGKFSPAREQRKHHRAAKRQRRAEQPTEQPKAAPTDDRRTVREQREPGESQADFEYRRAAERTAKRRRRAEQPTEQPKASPTDDRRTVREALSSGDAEIIKPGDLPSLGKAGKTLSRQAAKQIEQLARLFGKKVVIFSNRDGKQTDGFWMKGNTIYLNADSSVSQLRVLGHELTHAMRKEAPAAFQAMFNAVKHLLTDEEIRAQWADYHNGQELVGEITEAQRDFIAEEWMADLAGNRFGESQFWTDVFAQISAQYGEKSAKNTINQLRLVVAKVISQLLKAIQGGKFSVDERLAEHLEQIRDAVAKGFADYAVQVKRGVTPTEDSEVKFAGDRKPGSDVGHKRTAAGDYVGAPAGMTPAKLGALRTRLMALADEGKEGRMWYEESSMAILAAAEGDKALAEKISGLLAIYSPNATVSANTTMGLKALYQWANGEPISVRFKVQDAKAQAWMDGTIDENTAMQIKTGNFHRNLMRKIDEENYGFEQQGATIDMWMARVFGYGSKVIGSEARYLFAEREIKRLAGKLSWEPQQVQAALWVAIKSRIEAIADQAREIGQTKGWLDRKVVKVKGKENISWPPKPEFREEYETLMLNLAMGLDPDPSGLLKASYNFGTALQERVGQISWEAMPGKTTGVLPGIFDAPLAQQAEYLAAMDKALRDENGADLIAKKLNLPILSTVFGPSAWEMNVGAGAQTQVVVATDRDEKNKVGVSKATASLLNVYAAIRGLVLNQEAVVWHFPIYDAAKKMANGVQLDFGRDPTHDEVVSLYNAIHRLSGRDDWAPAFVPGVGVRVLNFAGPQFDKETKLWSFKDKSGKTHKSADFDEVDAKAHEEGVSNRAFQKLVKAAAASLPEVLTVSVDTFKSEGDYIGNDWKESPNGEDYRQRISGTGRSDLQGWVESELRPRAERVNQEFARKYGWDKPKFSPERSDAVRSQQTGANGGHGRSNSDGTTAGLLGRAHQKAGREGRIDLQGAHYSRAQRDHLTGSFFGSGLKGAEAERIRRATDSRIKSRLYAYIDEGQGVFPESGVGPFKHTVQLDNLYDLVADPLGLRGKTSDANERESLILDAGFDGVYVRGAFHRQGVAVLMGQAAIRGVKPLSVKDPAPAAPQPKAADPILSDPKLPAGQLLGSRWKELLAGRLEGVEALDDARRYYKDEVARAVGVKMSSARLAPNGKPSKLTERQWHQVRTPAFKAWFGDWEKYATTPGGVWADGKGEVSKAVDAETGEPLVVHHGSENGGFTVLDPRKGDKHRSPMIFTAANRLTSLSYSGSADEVAMPVVPKTLEEFERYGFTFETNADGTLSVINPSDILLDQSAKDTSAAIQAAAEDMAENAEDYAVRHRGIYSLFLNIRNPYEAHFEGGNWDGEAPWGTYEVFDGTGDQVYGEDGGRYFSLEDAMRRAEEEGGSFQDAQGPGVATNSVAEEALRFGHDGAIIRQVVDDGGRSGSLVEADDVFVIFDANQAKSATQNTGAFSRDSDDLRFSTARKPWYFSQLARTVEAAPAKVFGTAAQVRLWLTGNAPKMGVKKDELQWSGVMDWLELQGKAKVSKEEVLAYLDQNGVQVQEVEKGAVRGEDLWIAEDDDTEYDPAAELQVTKYDNYTLPGGENYRELLLTLPPTEVQLSQWKVLRPDGQVDATYASEESARIQAQRRGDGFSVVPGESKKLNGGFRSSHWDEHNILAHVRFNDRTDADGNKVLFIEELQSDWGQEGKKRGFAPVKLEQKLSDAEYARAMVLQNTPPDGLTEAEKAELNGLLSRHARSIPKGGLIPAAPFVTDTKAWLALGVKRMIAYAVEKGYNKVAFVNGEQSAERYDLSKQISRVVLHDNSSGGIGKPRLDGPFEGGNLTAYDLNGKRVIDGRFISSDSELADAVGKEVAERLLAAQAKEARPGGIGVRARELSGLDLKVGGEGMKTFYDQIVPQVVGDVLKKLGGWKVETVEFTIPKGKPTQYADFATWQAAPDEVKLSQLGFAITPEIQAKVAEGLPLFSPARRIGDAIDRTIAKVDHAVDGLSNLPNQFDYLKDRYKALGKVARVDEIVQEIRDAFATTDPSNKKAVYDYLTTRGASANSIPDAKVRSIAERIKKTIEYVGDQLVARGLLDPEAREHYRDQYLPRMYLRHMLNDQDYKVIGMGKKPSEMGYLKHRKDIPEEIREVVLGEIKDPAFLSANAIGRAMRDVSLLDWMGKIAQNNDWTFPDIFVDWQGKKVTAYWLRAEADRIELQAEHYEPAAQKKAEAMVTAMRKAANQALGKASAIDHTKYKQIPDTRRYGLLRGMWVRREIFDDIMGASQIVNAEPTWFENWFGFGGKGTKLTQWWKFTKVALNPPGQIRNFLSNMVMLQLSGVGLHKLPLRLIEAARDITSDGPYWKVAKKYGVTESTFTAQEMFRVKRDLLELEAQAGKLNSLRWLMSAGAAFLDKVSDLYQFSEALGKTIKIIDEMKKGRSEAEAAIEAQKWLFDYSLVPQSVRLARNAPIGMPFITYQIKVLPRLMEVAAKHPWRFLPWAGLLYGMQMAVASLFGVDDDELEKLKKALPEWLQDRGHTVFLPWRDEDGRIQVADVGYFFPWTWFSTMGKHAADGKIEKVLVDDIGGQFSAPIIGAAAALMSNYDTFTKRPIYNSADPVSYQAASIANYAYDLMAPPFLSSHGVVSPMGLLDKKFGGKMTQALMDTTNRFGDPKATEAQAIGALVGANFYGMDPEHTRITNMQVMNAKVRDVERQLRYRLMDQGLAPEQRAKYLDDYKARMQELALEMQEYSKASEVPEALKARR